ncbi:MAG: c-type cytochrome [Betaproteobacteria bacterium]
MLRKIAVMTAVGASLAAPAAAQTPDLVRLIAANCANCHGTDGRAQDMKGGVPALNGVAKGTIVSQIQDFKSGKRAATIMHQISKGYTDAEIDAVAGYFSSLKK